MTARDDNGPEDEEFQDDLAEEDIGVRAAGDDNGPGTDDHGSDTGDPGTEADESPPLTRAARDDD